MVNAPVQKQILIVHPSKDLLTKPNFSVILLLSVSCFLYLLFCTCLLLLHKLPTIKKGLVFWLSFGCRKVGFVLQQCSED